MGLSLHPERLKRYKDVGRLLFKYGRADLLHAAYLEALGRLQDSVAPFSFADVERTVQEDFGFRMSKGFSTFEAEPIAAASLGQVHRATLRDGRDVAVTVQRPTIREGLAQDLSAMDDIGK